MRITPAGRPLAARELSVLRGMARGLTNRDIGLELYVSEETVKTYARRLFRKLRAVDRANAVALGYERGLIPIGHADEALKAAG